MEARGLGSASKQAARNFVDAARPGGGAERDVVELVGAVVEAAPVAPRDAVLRIPTGTRASRPISN